jgi:hypothetical protein
MVSGRLSQETLGELAERFQVSLLVIRHQVENHGIGYLAE